MSKAVPEGWKYTNLADVAMVNMGQSPSSKDINDARVGIPFLQGNAEFNDRYPTPLKWCTSPLKLAEKGDILISVRAPVGALNMADQQYCIGRGLAAIRFTKINREFGWYALLKNIKQLNKISQGSTFEAINKDSLEQFKIHFPSLPEQQKIATILSSVDTAIEKTKAVIEQTKVVKKGLMQELLTRGIPGRHKKFKKTPSGEIPEEWEVRRLEDVASIERGKFQHRPRNVPRFYGGKHPFVQTGDVTNSGGRIKSYCQTLNDEGLAISKLFPKGTVLITIAANIGETAIAEFDLAFPDSLIGMIAKNSIDNRFLEYYLRTRKLHFNKLATESAQKNINLETLKPYPVPVPSIEEQKSIADFFETIEKKEDKEKKLLDVLMYVKSALMQVLLTGKVELN